MDKLSQIHHVCYINKHGHRKIRATGRNFGQAFAIRMQLIERFGLYQNFPERLTIVAQEDL